MSTRLKKARVSDDGSVDVSESHKLTEQQKLLIRYYIKDGMEPIAAARKAGYNMENEVCLRQLVKRTTKSKKGKDYINEMLDEIDSDSNITVGQIQGVLKGILLDTDTNLSYRLKAAELLGKALNMFSTDGSMSDVDSHAKLAEEARNFRQKKLGIIKGGLSDETKKPDNRSDGADTQPAVSVNS